MDEIVYFSKDNEIPKEIDKLKNHYKLQIVHSLRECAVYLVDHPGVSLFIYPASFSKESNESILEVLSRLNEAMPVLVIGYNFMKQFSIFAEEYKNVTLVSDLDRLPDLIEKTVKNRRTANRVNWPLSAKFFKADDLDREDSGLVCSLSSTGAFICTTDFDLLNSDTIFIKIRFEDFSFLVEGNIIRVSSRLGEFGNMGLGFAVQFVNVSKPVQSYISRLINDRLLSLFIGGESKDKI